MATYQSPLTVIVKGAMAGAAGTAVMGTFMERAPGWMERMGVTMPSSPPGPTAPDSPTEEVAERIVEGVAKRPIDSAGKARAGQMVHWSYGAGWGALFAVLQSSFTPPPLIHGSLFGAMVGVVADTVMPRLGLQNPPSRNPGQINVMHMAAHVVFGIATALTYQILNLGRRG